jgi:hypothetical protein
MKKITVILVIFLLSSTLYGQPRAGQAQQDEPVRYKELLEKTRTVLATCDNADAWRLLHQAEEETAGIAPPRTRVERQAARTRYANATRLLLRALDLCSDLAGPAGKGADEEFRRLEEQIEQARRKMASRPGEGDRATLNKLTALQSQARSALDAGQSGVAWRKMELIRILLNRLGQSGPAREIAFKQIRQLQIDIEKVRSTFPQPSPRATLLLQAAETQANDAEQFLLRRRFRPALAALAAGNRFLTRAAEEQPADEAISLASLESDLQELNKTLDALEGEQSGDTARQDDIRLCRHACEKARRALDNQQLELAQEYLELAREISAEIIE